MVTVTNIKTVNVETKIEKSYSLVKKGKLTPAEKKNLNQIDQLITNIMLKAEKKSTINNTILPGLRLFMIIFVQSQFKTKISFIKKIDFYTSFLTSPICIKWETFADIKRKLSISKYQHRNNKTNTKNLRNQHFMQRSSATNFENKLSSSKKITNIQKIEQVFIMWKKIKYLILENNDLSLQTIDILVDKNIKWNNIEQTPNLKFKTIDEPEIMKQVITDRNSHHLN